MKMATKQVSPFFTLFLVIVMQIGVGIFTFQRNLAEIIGNDGWIAILLSAVSIMVVIGLIYYILEEGWTIVDLHKRMFGRFIGRLLDLYFIGYFCLFACTILVIYVDMVIIWIFPDLYHGVLIFIIIVLAYLFTQSGFRTLMGLSVITIFMTIPLLFYSHYPSGLLQMNNLYPIWNHSFSEVASATKQMTFQYLGFEVLLAAFPFFKHAKKSLVWSQIGLGISTCMYVFTYILVYLVFTENHLVSIIWPTLSVWRMEYLGISIWLLILLPNICLYLWAASYIGKRSFKWRQKYWLVVLIVVVYGLALLLRRYYSLSEAQQVINWLGFYTLYVYIPCLALLKLIFKKRLMRNGKKERT